MISMIFPPHLRNLAVSLVAVAGSLLGAGVLPSAIGYLAEISSFSFSFIALGILTLATLPLLLLGRASAEGGDKAGRAKNPER